MDNISVLIYAVFCISSICALFVGLFCGLDRKKKQSVLQENGDSCEKSSRLRKSAQILYGIFFGIVLCSLIAVLWDADGISGFIYDRPNPTVHSIGYYPQIGILILGWLLGFAAAVLSGLGALLCYKHRKAADILTGIGWLSAAVGIPICGSMSNNSKLGDVDFFLLCIAFLPCIPAGIAMLVQAGKEKAKKLAFIMAIVQTGIAITAGMFLYIIGIDGINLFAKIHGIALLLMPFMLCGVALRYCVPRLDVSQAEAENGDGASVLPYAARNVLVIIGAFFLLWLAIGGWAMTVNNASLCIIFDSDEFWRHIYLRNIPSTLKNILTVLSLILAAASVVAAAFMIAVGCKTAFGFRNGKTTVTSLAVPVTAVLSILFALNALMTIPGLYAIYFSSRSYIGRLGGTPPFSDCLSGVRNLLCCTAGPLVSFGGSVTLLCLWRKYFAEEAKRQRIAAAQSDEAVFEQESAAAAQGRLAELTDSEREKFKKGSYFDGGLLGLIGVNLLTRLLILLSLGIAAPWMMCYRLRWYAKHTVYDGRRLRFDGRGVQLIGRWLLWLLLCAVTLGIFTLWLPSKLEKWRISHLIFDDSNENAGLSSFNGGMWGFVGFGLLQFFGGLFTLGLATPWIQCARERWLMRHTALEGFRLRSSAIGGALFVQYIKWYLLTIITLGIYRLWLGIKRTKWLTSKVTFADLDVILQPPGNSAEDTACTNAD